MAHTDRHQQERPTMLSLTSHFIICTSCNGSRYICCPECDGARLVRCLVCGGRGTAIGGQRCTSCAGNGQTRCLGCGCVGEIACPDCRRQRAVNF
jgi:hypothetical protein